MEYDDEFMIQAIMENKVNATVNEDEHLKIISFFAFISEAKCSSQTWMSEIWEKEDQERTHDGGLLNALH
jgi:hypothetical protein